MQAETIILKDGRKIENVSQVKTLDNVVVFYTGTRMQTRSLKDVQRILDDRDNTIYESVDLHVKRIRQRDGRAEYVFYRNGKEAGRCYWDNEGGFHNLSGRIPDGSYDQYYDSGKLERQFTIKNGTLNGVSRVYFESGVLEREGHFINGKEEGLSKLYNKSGDLIGESEFRDGMKNGVTKLYYASGQLRAQMLFVNGTADGEQLMYYPSGELEVKMRFAGGVKHGPMVQFYESGKPKFKGTYKNDKLDGEVVTLYESGRVKSQKIFHEGRILRSDDKAGSASKDTASATSK